MGYTINLLQQFVNEYQFPPSFKRKVHESRFDNVHFQLIDKLENPLLSLECGSIPEPMRSLNPDWHFIPLDRHDKGQTEPLEIDVDANRSGWCIPLSSIVDKEETSEGDASPREITNALYAATTALLFDNDCIESSSFTGNPDEAIYKFTDFYSEQFAVALIYKSRLPSSYVVDGMLSSKANSMIKSNLTSYGFVPKLHYTPHNTEWSLQYPDKKLKIKSISTDIMDMSEEYARMLIHAAEATHPVETYFFLIQIMESLSRVLWREGLKKVFDIANKHNPNHRRLRSTANWIAENKTTYKWIVEYASDRDRPSGKIFNDIANDVLTNINPEQNRVSQCSHSMALLRHRIVHSHSNWAEKKDAITNLKILNPHFFQLISEILSDFSISMAVSNLEDDIKTRLGVKEEGTVHC